jgi:hypothetical protein
MVMTVNLTESYKYICEKMVIEAENQFKNLKNKLSKLNPEWSKLKPISKPAKGACKKGSTLGVYSIVHEPTNELVYIGQGNVSTRKARHIQVFKNKGKGIIHKGGSYSGSQVAEKMYKFDSNIDNWLFSFTIIGEKNIIIAYEYELVKIYEPKFNKSYMTGK